MRRIHLHNAIALALVGALAVACSGPPFEPSHEYRIGVAEGDAQAAVSGAEFAMPLTVEVRNPDGNVAMGVRVQYATVPGRRHGGVLLDTVAVTDGQGRAAVRARAGAEGDTLAVVATLATLPRLTVRFHAVALAGPAIARVAPAAVGPGDTLVIEGSGFGAGPAAVTVGGVVAALATPATSSMLRVVVPPCADTGAVTVRVSVGGAPAAPATVTYRGRRTRLDLPPYGFTTVRADRIGGCVELAGGGATYLVAAQLASVPRDDFSPEPIRLGVDRAPAEVAASGSGAGASRAPELPGGKPVAGTRDGFDLVSLLAPAMLGSVSARFDRHRRELERQFTPGRAADVLPARATIASRAASRGADTSAPAVGSVRSFNVVTSTDGSSFAEVDAALEFVGVHILAYRDGAAPPLTQDLKALLNLMDSHLWSAAASSLGGVPDLDGNGRIIVLFTPAVNRLVRSQDCLQHGYVRGFFYPPDLIERAPHSNRGEVFYAFVPDESGRFSCAHTAKQVVDQLQPTFLHEMEHLISFNEHVLARGGEPEEMWLNEAMGRMAEELGSRFFESRYPAPYGRGSPAQLFPDSSSPFIGPLLLNAYVYLNAPLVHSATAYAGGGSLEDHGAGWLFLRWLADQKGDDLVRRMVQTRLTGVANVEAASGEGLSALLGDFGIALFADSLPGLPRAAVPPRLRYQGRALRQLMAREATVQGFPIPFPLVTYLAAPGTALRAEVQPGSMLHAILPTSASDPAVRVSLTTPGLQALAPSLGAQVGIMRLPP
ncbi:MAG: hypothetical protein IT356_05325 [Gemmatimonadaceae bacterium]|nr:hypothetical protein [Gemmatimonadaceae bacterium]